MSLKGARKKVQQNVLHGKHSEDSWQKKVDYQEGLEKSRADSAAWSHVSEGRGLDGEIMTAHLTIAILLIL